MTRDRRGARGIGGAAIGLAMAAGCGTKPPPAPPPTPAAPVEPKAVAAATLPRVRFVDATASSGLRFAHTNGARGKKLLPETMGSGVAVLDYDGDGRPDLFFVNSDRWPGDPTPGPRPTQALYRNLGGGRFEDASKAAGLDKSFYGMGAAVGDVDNDGDPDLYVTALGGGHLFRNDGGVFVDVTEPMKARGAAGWPTSAAFFDLENDGDLDLFICQYVAWSPDFDRAISTNLTGTDHPAYDPPASYGGSFCVLLRNDGATFADVSEAAGIRVRTPDLRVPVAKALGVAPFDYDGDGLMDLAVANDTVRNFLFRNLGGGTFEEVGVASGVAYDSGGTERAGMGVDWSNFRNDAAEALAVGNFANEMAAFFVADPSPAAGSSVQFFDEAGAVGLGAPTQPPLKFGLFFFDYDLDARPDLLLANGHLESDIARVQRGQTHAQSAQLYWNSGLDGRETFVLVEPGVVGPDLSRPIVGRGGAYLDFDGDGDLDVVLTANGGPAVLLRNDREAGGPGSLRVTLRGSASNRGGVGAKLTVEAGGVTQIRQHVPAKGYLSSVEPVLTFGLGRSRTVDRLVVRWPSGRTTELRGLPPGAVTVEEK